MPSYYSHFASSSALHSDVNFQTWQRKNIIFGPIKFFNVCTTEFCGEMPMTKLHQGVDLGKG